MRLPADISIDCPDICPGNRVSRSADVDGPIERKAMQAFATATLRRSAVASPALPAMATLWRVAVASLSAPFELQAISSRVHAFMLALINGERSMRDMARVLAEQRLVPAQESAAAVHSFLQRLHEESESL